MCTVRTALVVYCWCVVVAYVVVEGIAQLTDVVDYVLEDLQGV